MVHAKTSPTKKKLIAFMQKKASFLPCFQRNYFIKKDVEAIKNWSEEVAKHVLNELIEYFGDESIKKYDSASCVFCIAHESNCNRCEYRLNHGMCAGTSENLYDKIVELAQKKKDKRWTICFVIAEHFAELQQILLCETEE